MTLIAGILLLGILIFVHELGHFLVAKACGVRVLTFSLGFGPKIMGFKRGDTEYRLALLPLGGYVRMFGEDPAEDLDPKERIYSFMHQKGWRKSAIAAAGPMANFLLPIVLFFALALGEERIPDAVIGTVFRNSPAADAGLKPGDRLLAIDGQPVETFGEMVDLISPNPGKLLRLKIAREGTTSPIEIDVRPKASPNPNPLFRDRKVGRIGIAAGIMRPQIAALDPKGIAASAGLKTLDEIRSVDGKKIESIDDLMKELDAKPKSELILTLASPASPQKSSSSPSNDTVKTRSITLPPAGPAPPLGINPSIARFAVTKDELAALEPILKKTRAAISHFNQELHQRRGLAFLEGTLMGVKDGSTASRLGLKEGDKIIAIGGLPVNAWAPFHQTLINEPDGVHIMGVRQQDGYQIMAFRMALFKDPNNPTAPERKALGHIAQSAMGEGLMLNRHVGVPEALFRGVEETGNIIHMTLRGLWMLLALEVPFSNLGGPIMIFDLAGQAAERGLGMFIFLMCLISINLGVLNLLPIPVLDGGHLLMFAIEAIQKRPLDLKTRVLATKVGFAFLLVIMVGAISNDIMRYFGT